MFGYVIVEDMLKTKNEISEMAKILGSRGGKATSKKYGKRHYLKLAENMNMKKRKKKTLKQLKQ